MQMRLLSTVIAAAAWVSVGTAWAVSIETVPVENVRNLPDARYPQPHGPLRGFGGVDYAYQIGKYEVTTGQYAEFLNAVAAADPYRLYYLQMGTGPSGCGIQRSGQSGSYTYSVSADWANRPVGFISWCDAARFANWLHNGQPIGPQGPGTTEDGSYALNGATSVIALASVARQPNATWAIPTEDEWYKAAYHKNDGLTGNYWEYPTRSNDRPSNVLGNPVDPGNNATYLNGIVDTIGLPYYRTEVGAHENSGSPYGTFDQGGNAWEWCDGPVIFSHYRVMRGGSFSSPDNDYELRATAREEVVLSTEFPSNGFRLVLVPEPATLGLLSAALLGAMRRR